MRQDKFESLGHVNFVSLLLIHNEGLVFFKLAGTVLSLINTGPCFVKNIKRVIKLEKGVICLWMVPNGGIFRGPFGVYYIIK